jgi:hypothetical protein
MTYGVPMKDYYNILGVPPGSDTETIRKAYRTSAKVYHPDLNGSEQASAHFILLNEAHDILTDQSKRIPYDQQYFSQQHSKQAAKNFHYDWDSINRIQGRKRKRPPAPGPLLQFLFGIEMFLGFMEALLVLGYIFKGPVHPVYGVFAIPGILLVIDGWKGIVARRSVLGGIMRTLKRLI